MPTLLLNQTRITFSKSYWPYVQLPFDFKILNRKSLAMYYLCNKTPVVVVYESILVVSIIVSASVHEDCGVTFLIGV